MDKLYREFEKLTMKHEPLMAAAIMMAQAMKIYKAVLSEEEYKMITEHILDSRNDIISLEKPTIN